MVLLSQPSADDTYVNLGCGSGTLLIERGARGDARQLIGVDNSAENLACAQANIAANGEPQPLQLLRADMRQLPLESQSADIITADLPFGQLVGSHNRENISAFTPQILAESARIAKPLARFFVITHELRLMATVLRNSSQWVIQREIPITLRGLHPHIYKLVRRD